MPKMTLGDVLAHKHGMKIVEEPVRYVSAEKMVQDDFGIKFTMLVGEVVYDAKTTQGPWATMTQRSFERYAIGQLGLGLGQKYVRDSGGFLNKVEG